MPKLKGSQTEINLMAAFAGECQAYTRYSFFARQAQKEGLEQISALFQETADNEFHHAKIYWKYLEGGDVTFTGAFQAGVTGTTLENLQLAMDSERDETTTLYPGFGNIAQNEGFEEIGLKFYGIAAIEHNHLERYKTLYERLQSGTEFERPIAQKWVCRVCGHVHLGMKAPQICPVCGHPEGFFQIYADNY